MSEKVFPRGMRPVALQATAEKERAEAHPHRHASAKMLLRAMQNTAATEPAPQAPRADRKVRPAKRRGGEK
jgi:hypothetical protein